MATYKYVDPCPHCEGKETVTNLAYVKEVEALALKSALDFAHAVEDGGASVLHSTVSKPADWDAQLWDTLKTMESVWKSTQARIPCPVCKGTGGTERKIRMTKKQAMENLQRISGESPTYAEWYSDWAEGSGSLATGKTGILVGNWNHSTPQIDACVEILKLETVFYDEVCGCSNCNKLIQTNPNSMSYRPSYWVGDGEILCPECVDPVTVITWATQKAHTKHMGDHVIEAALIDKCELRKHGWVELKRFDKNPSGYHRPIDPLDDDVDRVWRYIRTLPIRHVVITYAKDYHATYTVYVKKADYYRNRKAQEWI